jgi:hypothetical protein
MAVGYWTKEELLSLSMEWWVYQLLLWPMLSVEWQMQKAIRHWFDN